MTHNDGALIEGQIPIPPAFWLWAKTSRAPTEPPTYRWHPLAAHLVDAALVAQQLWAGWLSPSTKRWLGEPLGGEDHARALFALLAGCHDLGKATPAFQIQVDWLHPQLRDAGLAVDKPLPQRSKAPHALASAATVQPLLAARGWSEPAIRGVAAILGGHHGWFPPLGYEREPIKRPELYGLAGRPLGGAGDPWSAARERLFDLVVEVAGAQQVLGLAGTTELGSARRLALAGFVILADWIASNEQLFPYLCLPYDDAYLHAAQQRAAEALVQLGWHGVANLGAVVGAPAFEHRFGFSPNALQRQTLEAVEQGDGGLVLIEAPMGMGKTEAALAAAEVLATRQGHGGAFIGLPTQATSNQMFHRTRRWLEQLGPGTFVLELAHGRAQQVPAFRDLLENGAPSAVDVDEGDIARVTAEAWFTGPKRRLLAPFVVGTIDQILLGTAKVRHVALRHVGLAGKVVILDEVHAYDAYMSVFLRRVLEWLGAERIPVILLSATLPPAVRARLIEAYAGHSTPLGLVGYPSITTVSTDGHVTTTPVATDASSVTVRLEHLDEDPEDESSMPLLEMVAQMAEAGANILVIRNTVARAQRTYRAVAERRPMGTVHLLHARFTTADRLRKESWLAEHFGRGGTRLSGQVVVGTQVLEQSLDIDFDVLATDLAPVDLVLQRIGRVHRHRGTRRPVGFTEPRVIVTGFTRSPTGPPAFPSGSVRVYGEHLLLRTAALLLARDSLTLPDDVPSLVAAVYGDDDVIAPAWHDHGARVAVEWQSKQHERERQAEQFVISDPTRAGYLLELERIRLGDDDDPRVQAAVRDSVPSIEVAIACVGPSPNIARFGTTEVSLEHPPTPDDVEAVLGSVVRLPSCLTEAATSLAVPEGWRRHPWLRRQRVLVLGLDGECSLGYYRIRYTDVEGLEVVSGGA